LLEFDSRPACRGRITVIFTNSTGGPLEPVVLNRDYKAVLKAAQLPSTLRFHDLRHSARVLASGGRHPRGIMELLGHSSITVTMNVYGCAFSTDKARAGVAGALAAAFRHDSV
jgi:integrase